MGIYRDYISDDADMQTMLFRYSIMVDVFNAKLPDELKCERKISDDLKRKILRQQYSEQNDRLILLFGMGIIGEATLKELVLHNKTDFLSDVINAIMCKIEVIIILLINSFASDIKKLINSHGNREL